MAIFRESIQQERNRLFKAYSPHTTAFPHHGHHHFFLRTGASPIVHHFKQASQLKCARVSFDLVDFFFASTFFIIVVIYYLDFKLDHITILHNVFLPFGAQYALFFCRPK